MKLYEIIELPLLEKWGFQPSETPLDPTLEMYDGDARAVDGQ